MATANQSGGFDESNWEDEDKPWKNRDRLKRLYNSGMTQSEIGELLGTSGSNISNWMGKFRIQTGYGDDSGRHFNHGDVDCRECGDPVRGNGMQCEECLDEARANDREDSTKYDTHRIH